MTDEIGVASEYRFALVPEALVLSHTSDAAVRVYLALALRANRQGACYPSLATIGREAGNKGRRTVQRALEDLEQVGALRVEARTAPSGRRTSNLYRILRMEGVTSDTDVTDDVDEGVTDDAVTTLNKTHKNQSTRVARADDYTSEAQRITSTAYDRDKMINYPAVMKLIKRMLSTGGDGTTVEKALMGVLDSGKPITAETLRLEYAKHKPRASRRQQPWEVD